MRVAYSLNGQLHVACQLEFVSENFEVLESKDRVSVSDSDSKAFVSVGWTGFSMDVNYRAGGSL